MTDFQIVSRETMFSRGAEAARKGKARDDHGMNSWAPAVTDWQAGHDYVTSARQKQSRAGAAMGARP
jgi:hypothetical protein